MRGALLGLALLALGTPLAAAAAPEASLRPVARDIGTESVLPSTGPARVRPEARPPLLEAALAGSLLRQLQAEARRGFSPRTAEQAGAGALAFAAVSPQAIGNSLHPRLRPGVVIERAMARQRERRRGAVCGDRALQGEEVGYVPGRIRGCGIDDAVSLRSVGGIALSTPALMDCRTAKALKTWVDRGLKPAVGRTGGGVAQMRVAAHYVCRTRNNQSGARISEHGRGRAIDLSGFTLTNGQSFSVLADWRSGPFSPVLRRMHRAACGPFGTVLGPDSDRFHQDHFHFDTARHRGGPYCR